MMIGESKDLSKERYVYIWADGIYFNVRSDDAKQCLLVIIGVKFIDGIDEKTIERQRKAA